MGRRSGMNSTAPSTDDVERPLATCAVTRRRFPVGARPTRRSLQPEATGAGMEVTKCLKPPDSGHKVGDCASVQAATRVNAEQTSKRTMCRGKDTHLQGAGRGVRLLGFHVRTNVLSDD